MAGCELVVIGASAGGLTALDSVLSQLPVTFAAPIAVVLHRAPSRLDSIVRVLTRHATLPLHEALDGEALEPGVVYLAPRDQHLEVGVEHTVRLAHSEPVHFARPAVDVLFQSAAAAYGEHVVAVVLSGAGRDGSSGVLAVQQAGGRVIVQDEASAEFFGMPSAAIGTGAVDAVLPLHEISDALVQLVEGTTP